MYQCCKCGEKYKGWEVSEWEPDEYSTHPFICPWCYPDPNEEDDKK